MVGGVAGAGVFAKQARGPSLGREKRTDEPQSTEVAAGAEGSATPRVAPADAAPAEASTAPADDAASTEETTTVTSDT